ncbi:hypothetical protein PR048_001896 [Dryococelus australis]|uniref:Uncharacterized protein n=1 Tax=Dryococelus australis TaxID=614101 RepID=A0ABQ9IIL6_9NEOP|nr:hypothetical protein PR048_001896 [Dryococelus australis]
MDTFVYALVTTLRISLQQELYLLLKKIKVSEYLDHPPPTKAIQVQSPAGSPDFRVWESCRAMPLTGGFSRGSPFSPTLSFRCCSILTSITLICSPDLAVNSRPNLFTYSDSLSSEGLSSIFDYQSSSSHQIDLGDGGAQVQHGVHQLSLLTLVHRCSWTCGCGYNCYVATSIKNGVCARVEENGGVGGEYGAAPKRRGGGNGLSPRKPVDQWYRPAQFPLAEIHGLGKVVGTLGDLSPFALLQGKCICKQNFRNCDYRNDRPPDFRMWESCRTMASVFGFSRGSPLSLPLHSSTDPTSPRFTLIGSQDLDVKSRPNLFTHDNALFSSYSYAETLAFLQLYSDMGLEVAAAAHMYYINLALRKKLKGDGGGRPDFLSRENKKTHCNAVEAHLNCGKTTPKGQRIAFKNVVRPALGSTSVIMALVVSVPAVGGAERCDRLSLLTEGCACHLRRRPRTGFNPQSVYAGFSHVEIVPGEDLPFPPPFLSGAATYSPQSPSSALKTSLFRAAQIHSLTH